MKQNGICLVIAFVTVVLPSFVFSQQPDSVINKPDSFANKAMDKDAWIESMDHYLAVKLSLNNNISGFHINNTSVYDIKANDKNLFKISVNYRWLSFSFSTAPKFLPGNDDNKLKGETKQTAYQFGFNFDHWTQYLSYSRVKGYYLGNTGDFDPGWVQDVDPYIQFPELVYSSISGHTAYRFNKNFSFSALTSQTERQLKSAGTFMPILSYNFYTIDDKTPLTGTNSSQKSKNVETLLSLGYFYSFVIHKNFYVSAGGVAGAGVVFSKLFTRLPQEEIITHSTSPVFRFEGNLSFGYNAKRFFTGVQLVDSRVSYTQEKTTNIVVNNRLIYQVFLGYRLGAPKKLKSIMDETEKKVPLL